jgi:hypothetical protein
MRKLFLSATLMLPLLSCGGHPAYAYPLSPALLKHCMPLSERASGLAAAADMGKVLHFDGAIAQRFIDAINDQLPLSDWTASQVDVVIKQVPADQLAAYVFLTDDANMCLIETAKKADWEKLADKVFGSGT